jgi:hypothetical protein
MMGIIGKQGGFLPHTPTIYHKEFKLKRTVERQHQRDAE